MAMTSAIGRRARDPLAGTELLLVDATNVLHALSRGQGAAPAPALIGRIRAALPPGVRIELVFDGPPESGMRGTRIAAGVSVRYAGRSSADDAILERLGSGAGPALPGALETASILVVTNDRGLATAARAAGARTAGAAWLTGRLEHRRIAAPVVGNLGRPRAVHDLPSPAPAEDDEGERPRWQPGRGATVKRGNPRRPGRRRPPGVG
jgi:hypothetical protein